MSDVLRPYPEYKDSGVEWLGEIPAHWALPLKLKYLSGLKGRLGWQGLKASEYTDEGPYIVSSAHFKEHKIDWSICPHVTSERYEMDANIHLAQGDILLMKDGASMGKIGYVDRLPGKACLNSHLLLLRPIRQNNAVTYDSRYMFYFLICAPFQNFVQVSGTGATFNGVSQNSIENYKVCLPPLSEQAAIVRYLDHADRPIRRYIAAKRKQIALLNEQKQAIIKQAVTRGLDPNVRLKPSGVEWLGDVPEHWEVWQIGHLAKVGNGSTPSRGNLAYWNDGFYPWLNSSSVNKGTITEANQFVTSTALRECHLPIVKPQSVLVAITGQGKTRGTAALLLIESTINQHIAYITPNKTILLPEYLYLALSGLYKQLRAISESGSTKGALTCFDLMHFRLAIPPINDWGDDSFRSKVYLGQKTAPDRPVDAYR